MNLDSLKRILLVGLFLTGVIWTGSVLASGRTRLPGDEAFIPPLSADNLKVFSLGEDAVLEVNTDTWNAGCTCESLNQNLLEEFGTAILAIDGNQVLIPSVSRRYCSTKQADEFQTATMSVSKTVDQAVEAGQVAGAVHLVGLQSQIVHSHSAGVRDINAKSKMDANTIVRIYSMTKPITSVAAMRLFEAGKFQLDDPVSKYIESFKKTTVWEVIGGKGLEVPANRPITIRDVFRHTTGFSYGGNGIPEVERRYRSSGMFYRPPNAMMPPDMTIEQAADAMATIPALHHPGEKFTYGFNTDLLGRLIEIWSEKPLDQYIQEAVLDPLQMHDTGFNVAADKRDRFASCHSYVNDKLTIIDKFTTSPFLDGFSFQSGGGGLMSTANDYAKFCQMLVDGGQREGVRILKQETLTLMFQDQLNGVAGGFEFGLGFAINQVDLGSGDGKRKVTQYSWGGYASTDFRVIPEERLFQIFVRQHIPSRHELAGQVFERIYQGLTKIPTKAGDSQTDPGPEVAVIVDDAVESDDLSKLEPTELGEHGFADSNGVKIHYVTKGEGPLLVLLHGFPDYWYTWRDQIPALSKHFQVVAIDLRGYNYSDQPKGVENYAMPKLVGDVKAVIEHFGQKEAVIVGHDWGGMIAWTFAMQQPGMTQRLIILNLPHPAGLTRELARNPEQQAASEYAREFQQPDAASKLTPQSLTFWVRDSKARKQYVAAFKRSSIEGMLNFYKANYPRQPYQSGGDYPKVKCSVLQIHGLKDTALLPSGLNDTWLQLEKDLTLVTVPEAGHFVQQDASEFVTKQMLLWLNR